MFCRCSPKLLAEHRCDVALYSLPRLTRPVLVCLLCAALAALAVAHHGHSHGAPPTPGYDYQEPLGNNPGGAVVKVRPARDPDRGTGHQRSARRAARVTPIWQDQGPLGPG